MSVYNWLCLFGVPAIIAAIFGYVIKRLKRADEETKAVKLGVQALLRDRLYQLYRVCEERGYTGAFECDNFENMYSQYHALGANGVMDEVRKKFLELPIVKP